MSPREIAEELDLMSAKPGIRGCALVDAATGMIWLASASAQTCQPVWEAAVDYWRLHERQKLHFARLGALRAAVMYHASGMLAVLPCCSEPELLLIAQAEHRAVDWLAWQKMVRKLGQLIRGGDEPQSTPSSD